MLKSISADPGVVTQVLGVDHAKISALLLGSPFVNAPALTGPSNIPMAGANPIQLAAAQPLAGPSRADMDGLPSGTATSTVTTSMLNANKRPHDVAQPHLTTSALGGISASTSMSAMADPSNAAASPPAKRRKTAYDEEDVIDLT